MSGPRADCDAAELILSDGLKDASKAKPDGGYVCFKDPAHSTAF
jgi:hypothetical protein